MVEEKYAVYVNAKEINFPGRDNIILVTEGLEVKRYDAIDKAIMGAVNIQKELLFFIPGFKNAYLITSAGVIPIDEGEHVYRTGDLEIEIGKPIYVIKPIMGIGVNGVDDSIIDEWIGNLESTNKKGIPSLSQILHKK